MKLWFNSNLEVKRGRIDPSLLTLCSTDYDGNIEERQKAVRDYVSAVRSLWDAWYNRITGAAPLRRCLLFLAGRVFDPDFSLEWDESADDATRKWCDDFIKRSHLRGVTGQAFAVGGEIQGQALITLEGDKDEIKAEFVPMIDQSSPAFGWTYRMTADNKVSSKGEFLELERYVYVETASPSYLDDLNRIRVTPVTLHSCLDYAQNSDVALQELRSANHAFAFPVLTTEHESAEDRDDAVAWFVRIKWKLGKMLHLVRGKAYYVQPSPDGSKTLTEESLVNIKRLSGFTGVPLHKLGEPGEMSNRSTAEVMEDHSPFKTARNVWETAIYELLKKAMNLYGGLSSERLRGVRMNPLPPELIATQQEALRKDFEIGAITLETYLANHPVVEDGAAEAERVREQRAADAARTFAGLRSSLGGEDDNI